MPSSTGNAAITVAPWRISAGSAFRPGGSAIWPGLSGGFGARKDLYAAYEAASGRKVDDDEVRYWEIFGMVRWAILNVMQGFGHVHEGRRSMVWAACGRNVAMVEHELMQALSGRAPE